MIKSFFNLENKQNKKNMYVESVKCIYFCTCYEVGQLFIVGEMMES